MSETKFYFFEKGMWAYLTGQSSEGKEEEKKEEGEKTPGILKFFCHLFIYSCNVIVVDVY